MSIQNQDAWKQVRFSATIFCTENGNSCSVFHLFSNTLETAFALLLHTERITKKPSSQVSASIFQSQNLKALVKENCSTIKSHTAFLVSPKLLSVFTTPTKLKVCSSISPTF